MTDNKRFFVVVDETLMRCIDASNVGKVHQFFTAADVPYRLITRNEYMAAKAAKQYRQGQYVKLS